MSYYDAKSSRMRRWETIKRLKGEIYIFKRENRKLKSEIKKLKRD